MAEENAVYLIDGSAYLHRAFHAIRGLSNSQGLPTNAVFGLANMLLALQREKSPHYIAVCFDARGKNFRHDLYPAYKANRPPMDQALSVQIPYARRVVEGLRIPLLEVPGFEADDVIATLADKAEAQGFFVVMVTGDKDFNQLVTDKITIWDPMKAEVRDKAFLTKSFGLAPLKLLDVQALSGDPTDNIPGVPGIGGKTAVSLIQEFGSLQNLYENLDKVGREKTRKALIENRDQAFLSRDLAKISKDAPVTFSADEFAVKAPDTENLTALFRELEFSKLLENFSQKTDISEKKYHTVLSENDLSALAAKLSAASRIAVDTETTSTDPMRAVLVGMSFCVTPSEAWYVPVGHRYLGAPEQIPRKRALELLAPVLTDPNVEKVGQNIKYDWIVLSRHGVTLSGVAFDTMVASYLLNPGQRSHGLDQIAQTYLNVKKIKYEEVTGAGGKSVTFDLAPVEKAAPYSCEDADTTLAASEKLAPLLAENGLSDLYKNIEMPLVRVLKDMEMRGVAVDKNFLAKLSDEFAEKMAGIEKKIYEVAGERFNISSPQQLGFVLFEKLGLPYQKKTKKKTGYSTDVSVLTELSAAHELPALVLSYRGLAKLKSTYADALLTLVNPETGRVHTSFNQNVAATGRLSSSDPNLQNIPIRTEEGRRIREAFVPGPGNLFLSADYSQIELRILAHYSQDPVLMESFAKNEDVHRRTASEVFSLAPEYVTEEMRRQAKAINFGLIYGMGAFRLSRELGISQKLAKQYIEGYFATYRGVRQFVETVVAQAEKTQRTTTLCGRIRNIPEIQSSDRVLREAARRIAINTPLQGTAADFIKIAMIRAEEAVREKGLSSRLLLSVHDELVFEAPEEEIPRLSVLVKGVMENVWPLSVPLTINIATGANWALAHG